MDTTLINSPTDVGNVGEEDVTADNLRNVLYFRFRLQSCIAPWPTASPDSLIEKPLITIHLCRSTASDTPEID